MRVRTLPLLLGSIVALCACSPQKVGTIDESQLRVPRTISGNDFIVSGCCSLNTEGWSAEKHTSDSFSATLTRPGASIDVVFGPYDAGIDKKSASQRTIDDVVVYMSNASDANAIKPWEASAEVPPSEAGEAANLRPYTLHLTANCETAEGCQASKAVLDSLRF